MDIVTQAVLGASVSQAAAKKEHIRTASIIGLFSGILADADTFIRSSEDPLLYLEFHRHFSHSLFFIPFGALLATLLLWPIFKKQLSLRIIYFYALLGYALSGVIDACTSYGTNLLWPFSDERISWHIISIVDPVFTIILLLGLVLGFKKLNPVYVRLALSLAVAYLLLATFQLNRAEESIHQLAKERGHTINKIMVKPTFGNILLWRSVYLSDNHFYIDAVRAGIANKIYEGSSIQKLDIGKELSEVRKDTTLYKDILRFEHFSNGFLSQHPTNEQILGDARYAMSPLSAYPLWGIEIDIRNQDRHVKYEFYRSTSEEKKQQFIDMLLGKELD